MNDRLIIWFNRNWIVQHSHLFEGVNIEIQHLVIKEISIESRALQKIRHLTRRLMK